MKNDYRRVLALPFDTAVGVHFDQMDAEAFKGFVPLIKLMPKSYSMPTVFNYHFILVLTIKSYWLNFPEVHLFRGIDANWNWLDGKSLLPSKTSSEGG